MMKLFAIVVVILTLRADGYFFRLEVQLSDDDYTLEELEETVTILQTRVGEDVEITIVDERIIQVRTEDENFDTSILVARGLLEFVDFSALPPPYDSYAGECITTTAQLEFEYPIVCETAPINESPLPTVITGDALETVSTSVDSFENGQISFELDPEASTLFAEFTGANIGQPLAIVIDGEIVSVPIIQAAIFGSGVISGTFTEAEAESLAAVLRSEVLPLPLALVD